MKYAITINKAHKLYIDNLELLTTIIKDSTESDYVELVNHSNDHLHGLIDTSYTLQQLKELKAFHVEPIRNTKAYIKYMHSHDEVDTFKWGQLQYEEIDSIVDSILSIGAVKTVQKYGMQALRIYKQIKEFEEDYKNQI